MKEKKKNSASFLVQLGVATTLIGAAVGGLLWVGRAQEKAADAFLEGAPGSALTAPWGQLGGPGEPPKLERVRPERDLLALLPSGAWLVVLLDGKLFPGAPFAEEPSPCREVTTPDKALFAVVPGREPKEELSFFLATASSSELFRRCAREKIEKARGKVLKDDASGVVLSTPSGTFLDGKDGRLLFSTALAAPALLPELLRGTLPAGRERHVAALRGAETDGTLLALSVELPENWLSEAGDDLGTEAKLSSLKSLTHAELFISASGEGRGELLCRPEDAPGLAAFLRRAYNDLLGSLPSRYRGRFEGALEVRHPVPGRPGTIEVVLSPRAVELGQALLRYATD